MNKPRRPRTKLVVALFAALLALTTASVAQAQDNTIKQPGDHPNYFVEIEPHLDLAWFTYAGYGFGTDVGLGLGLRATIIIVKNGFVPTINNSVGIGFGGDVVYFGCGAANCPGVWALTFPVVMQWNFFVAQRFSVFGEPGLSLNYAFYQNLCGGLRNCVTPSAFFPDPVFEVGGRYHINEHLALTARVGYPYLTFGVSFM